MIRHTISIHVHSIWEVIPDILGLEGFLLRALLLRGRQNKILDLLGILKRPMAEKAKLLPLGL